MQKTLELLSFAEYQLLILENQPLEEKSDHESSSRRVQFPTPRCSWLRGICHYLSYRQIQRILSGGNILAGRRDFLGGSSSPSMPATAQHPAEDSSESGDSPDAQEFQPLEQFFPRGTVVGFDYEESVQTQEIF